MSINSDVHKDSTWSVLFWIVVLFVCTLVAAWVLHGVTYWAAVGWEQSGSKAPGAGGGGELARVHAEHARDLENPNQDDPPNATVLGDLLTLKNGTLIDAGLVYTLEDPADDEKVKVFVKQVPFLKIRPDQKSDFAKFTVVQDGEELKFLPEEVSTIQKGMGKKLTISFAEAQRAFLAKHGGG